MVLELTSKFVLERAVPLRDPPPFSSVLYEISAAVFVTIPVAIFAILRPDRSVKYTLRLHAIPYGDRRESDDIDRLSTRN